MVQQYAAARTDLAKALELLEEEATEQQVQQQHHLRQQLTQREGTEPQAGAAALWGFAGGESGVSCAPALRDAAAALQAAGPLQAAAAYDEAVRGSSRCLTPCTLARMRLNNGYWQQRVMELLVSIKAERPVKQ